MIWRERTVRIEQVHDRADWLSADERDAVRVTPRHQRSIRARLLAGQLLVEAQDGREQFTQLHIESRDGRNRSTRPQAYFDGRLSCWNLSLSHSDRLVSAAILPVGCGQIGVDLVDLTSLSVEPLKCWLTPSEARRVTDPLSMGMIWSLKEAIYKATNEGTPFCPLRIDTPRILAFDEWSRLVRALRSQGAATGVASGGWTLSLNLIDETIKTLVWCPAARRVPPTPASV